MYIIQPFEIIFEKEYGLLISQLASVDLTHGGMKEILQILHNNESSISKKEIENLFHNRGINVESGIIFLLSTGVIIEYEKEKSEIWSNVNVITDNADIFIELEKEWQKDNVFINEISSLDVSLPEMRDNSIILIHQENYSGKVIRDIYEKYHNLKNVAFLQSYFLKDFLKIDGVFSSELGTPCHFCHINRWVNREDRSFRKNKTSWENIINLLQQRDIKLPAIKLSKTDRGFVLHIIKRRLQELTGNILVKLHTDTFMNSLNTNMVTCIPTRDPVSHWSACDCNRRYGKWKMNCHI